uniref:Uncharacterized protein n=1 Tax=Setaria viridis TaxID=4556 RepID=A0A4U6V110_SETVI|nr:hypothetical protein SEVIR_4G247201v2 [Setaria viridis]
MPTCFTLHRACYTATAPLRHSSPPHAHHCCSTTSL